MKMITLKDDLSKSRAQWTQSYRKIKTSTE